MRAPTIKDVAENAGVSPSTVSLVIRQHPRVSAPTVARVRESMKAVGYVYNRRAAEMRTRRTMSLGLVVTDVRNPYFAELAMAIEQRAFESGYTILHGYSQDQFDRQQRVLETLVEHQVDGVILLPASGTDAAELANVFSRGNLPHSLVARRVANYSADYFGIDNELSGELNGNHLRSLGIRQIAFLGGPSQSSARDERISGLHRGLRLGRDERVLSIPTSVGQSGGVEAVTTLLRTHHGIDAIVAYNDIVAMGIMTGLRLRGIEPGREIAVASFDNLADALHQQPALTSVDGHPDLIGSRAIDRLIERIEQPSLAVEEVLLEPTIHVRESTSLWRGRSEE